MLWFTSDVCKAFIGLLVACLFARTQKVLLGLENNMGGGGCDITGSEQKSTPNTPGGREGGNEQTLKITVYGP